MNRLVVVLAGAVAVSAAARADVSNDFSDNPLTDPQVLIQGPDAGHAASRFTYDGAAQTLTAHFDSTAPTLKLVFPLGQHLTQNDSFTVSTTFTIQSAGFVSPPDFGAAAPSFGLVNSITTGTQRATTGHFDMNAFQFVEDSQGTAYDLMTLDYYPTQDMTFGGNSMSLTTVQSGLPAASFNSRVRFGYASTPLALDQAITATFSYSAQTHMATLDWGGGSVPANLSGAVFDVDAFAITLWNDPNLNPPPPSDASGSAVGGAIVFDSFSVQAPEPASVWMMAAGGVLLLRRRRVGVAGAEHYR
jgi:hypothetical protein